MKCHQPQTASSNERLEQWRQTVANVYFPLELQFANPDTFSGELGGASLGDVHLSRLRSSPASYERQQRQLDSTIEEAFLITIPRVSPVEFVQLGREVRCEAGSILVERGDAPYRFHYSAGNDLHVLKVSRCALAERASQPDRFCAQAFDGTQKMGLLFSSMVSQADVISREMEAHSASVVGRQLLELLALVLENDPRVIRSNCSTVRTAHLQRAKAYIRANLTNPALSPGAVADACSISKRYLHDLFRNDSETVGARIRQERLIAARDRIEAGGTFGIADVAYEYGFSDQAQFSRLFKAVFGQTPSGCRNRALVRQQTKDS